MAERFSPAQRRLVGFIVVVAVASIAYRLVYASGFQRTAALYVGVPAVLAIGLALLPRSGRAVDVVVKGSLLALLIASVILPEGIICLLLAAPLVVLVAGAVGTVIDSAGDRRRRREGRPLALAGLPLLLLSLEGVVGTPFDPNATATATVTVEADADEVTAALARPPTFAAELPAFLRFGFNRPVGASGSGIAVGDTRAISFDGGTHDDHPMTAVGLARGEHGTDLSTMHLRVVASEPGRVVFAVTHDGTMLARWVDLDRAVFTWREDGAGTTEVGLRFEYERLLFPSFYFAPLQAYGMDLAAEYLLEAVVAPSSS